MGIVSQYTKDDKRILFFVALIWGVDMLYYLKAVVMRLPIINLLANIFIPSVIIISLLVNFSSLLKRFKTSDYLFYLIFFVFYVLSFALFPSNDKWLMFFMPMVFFQMLPYFFVGILIEPQKQIKVIEYVSMAYIVFSWIYLTINFTTRSVEGEEMGLAYALLPHLLVVLNSCFRNFKWYSLIIFLFGLFRLFGTGNRGSLVCVALYVLLYLFFCLENKHKLLVSLLFLIAVVFVWVRQDLFFGYLSDVLNGFGFNTRAINMVLNDEFADANGRDVLANFFIEKIESGGVLGYGIFGDRTLLNAENGYPHNIALEILIDFGIPLGSILLITLVVLLIRSINSCKTKESKSFFFILFVVGLVELFLSNSYLSNPMFFLMIGYAVRSIRDSRLNTFKDLNDDSY